MGFGLNGSEPDEDAKRELFEETGATPQILTKVGEIGIDYVTHLYFAKIEPKTSFTNQNSEETESIQDIIKFHKNQISNGELYTQVRCCVTLYLVTRFLLA